MQIQAYEAIRTGIVYAKYAPGDKLQVKDLCADLGLGRTLVRKSLVRLRQERLVETVPQSGTYVSKIRLEAVGGTRYARESLESQISVEACARLDARSLAELHELLAEGESARDAQDRRAFFDSDNLFHEKLYDIAGKQQVWSWLEFISIDLQRCRWLRVQTEDLDQDAILGQHREIVRVPREEGHGRDAFPRLEPSASSVQRICCCDQALPGLLHCKLRPESAAATDISYMPVFSYY